MNLKSALEDILFSQEDYFLITRGVNNMYKTFSETTEIFAGSLTNEHMKETPNGKIVTPVHAAHCVKDLMRTTKFLRGIYKAIKYYLDRKSKVQILYAGCGPYATLLTPFTSMYSPGQLRFTFLEIEEISFRAVQKLYADWKLEAYLEEIKLCDATDPALTLDGTFNIIVSETMQVGLKNECQVPITRNLVRFLELNGTFIPQRIKLDVFFNGTPKNNLSPNSAERSFVGTAFDLDFKNLPPKGNITWFRIPESPLEYLKLYTDIHVFADEYIEPYQSGLTLALTLDRPVNKTGRWAQFEYLEGPIPELLFEYLPENQTPEMA